MKHKTLFIAIITFIIVPLGFYFLIKKRNHKKLSWYTTGQPIKKDLLQYITASGRLQAKDQITVGSLEAGRIINLHVDDNDFVKKDQVLVELDNGIGYSAVKKAKAALIQAKAELSYLEQFYKRQTELYKSGQLAKDTFESYTKDYQTALAQVEFAQGDLEIRQQEYDNLFIKAPDDGIITSRKVDIGQMITARLQATVLFTIAKDLKKMEAEIDVDEADIGLVKNGQEAIFTVDAFPQKAFHAKIKEIHYEFKIVENVITYAVILNVANPDLQLRPGMTTNVDIKVADAKSALCVPNKAFRVRKDVIKLIAQKESFTVEELPEKVETKAKETLWVLVNNNHFKQIHVDLGVSDGKYRQVIDSITPDTHVVIEALDPSRENPIIAMGKLKV